MSGIAGVFNTGGLPQGAEHLRRISRALGHRGPDDQGYLGWRLQGAARPTLSRAVEELGDVDVALIHRRLSILDLSPAGWQPMCTEDGRFSIVFNGEIYNYLELREALRAEGWEFSSGSDTEVLLKAFAAWGPNCLCRLVGMFAFAVLDLEHRVLFLARDFFGVKPLVYWRSDAGFAFASEIKALLELDAVPRVADPQATYEYLRLGLVSHGHATMFRDVRALPAGHYMKVSLNAQATCQIVQYWHPAPGRADVPADFDEAVDDVRELFLDNVRLHLRSDVPVGAALSGGIDAASIVAAMRQLEPAAELHSFSFIAADAGLGEESWVDLVGREKALLVHKCRPGPGDMVAAIDDLIRTQDEPFASVSVFARYCVFRLAQEHGIKVMVDGQGADETLAGSMTYLGVALASLFRRARLFRAVRFMQQALALPSVRPGWLLLNAARCLVPRSLLATAGRFVGEGLFPGYLRQTWFAERNVEPVRNLFAYPEQGTLLTRHLCYALAVELPALLRHEDRNSMRFSVENRAPFLTPGLVDYVLSLPDDWLVSNQAVTRSAFGEAMRGMTPDPILDRRDSTGSASPETAWFGELRTWAEAVLASDAAAQADQTLNLAAGRVRLDNLAPESGLFDPTLWRVLNLIKWAEVFGVRYD